MAVWARQRERHSGPVCPQLSVGLSFSPCARGRTHEVACPVHFRSIRRGIHALALVRSRLADGGAGLHRRHAAGHAHHHLLHHGCGVLCTQLATFRALAAGASIRSSVGRCASGGKRGPSAARGGAWPLPAWQQVMSSSGSGRGRPGCWRWAWACSSCWVWPTWGHGRCRGRRSGTQSHGAARQKRPDHRKVRASDRRRGWPATAPTSPPGS